MEHVQRVCEECGSDYVSRTKSPGIERFCGKKCNTKFWNRKTREKIPKIQNPPKSCIVCGALFTPRPNQYKRTQTCSFKCSRISAEDIRSGKRAAKRNTTPKICEICHAKYEVGISMPWENRRFCSQKCACKSSGKKRYKKVQHELYDGNCHPCRKRDGFKCVRCGGKKSLHVHHIDGSGQTSEPNHALENLVTLCGSCHKSMHAINFRIINNQPYVSGLVFAWLKLESVKVLKGQVP